MKNTGGEMLKVFVYGWLKSGGKLHEGKFRKNVAEKKNGTIKGDMYLMPEGYPAVCEGRGTVHGELLYINDTSVINILDEHEDYYPVDPGRSLYIRKQAEVTDESGGKEYAYVYFMEKSKILDRGGTYIKEGKYLKDK